MMLTASPAAPSPPPVRPPATSSGCRLGKYRLLEKIGAGAMGEVFKARDEVLERSVALKTIAGVSDFGDQELLRLFRREAQAAAGLNHPHIVTVHDFGEDDGQVYLVMELLDGVDLHEALRAGRFANLGDKLELMRRVAGAMAYAHERGFVHRDLKPANVRVLDDGTPKVLDFGLARAREAELTRTGRVVGTPHYMAPEQIRGERLDARADVFALGVVLYEVLTGRRPFPANDLHGVLFQILHREPEPVRDLDPALPPALDGVVARALAKDAAERYRHAGELEQALAGVDPDSAPSEPGPLSVTLCGAELAPAEPVPVVFRHEDDGDRTLDLRDRRSTLLDLSLANGIAHYHECGGRARCSSCRVRVLAGQDNLEPRTPQEEKLARRLGWTDDVRLACQTRVRGPVEVKRLVHDTQDLGLMLPSRSRALAPQEMALAVVACELLDLDEHLERLPPYDLFHLLNRFFLQVGEAVIAAGGRIESYTDTGFRAFFGLEGGGAGDKCLAAARAAVRATARMEAFSAYTAKYFSCRFRLGVGLDFTRVIVGRLGHPSKSEIAALGTPVQVASGASAANRRHGTTLLATEGFVNVVEDELRIGRVLAEEPVAGARHTLYEVLDLGKPDAAFLVQKTFELCEGRTEEMAEIFYGLLFELAPRVRELFAGTDMDVQRRMLMEALAAAVRGLDDVEALAPVLRELGRRHVGYGVELHHYDLVEHVLIETIRRMIGDEFTDDVRLAWTKIYNVVAGLMTEGMS